MNRHRLFLAAAVVTVGASAVHARNNNNVGMPWEAVRAATRGVFAQDSADRTAIRNVALDYIEGWYTGDAARMERALHPELAKRMVRINATGSESILDQQSAMTLVQGTRAGYGKQTPEARRQKEVTILDVYGNAASVKIVASDWIDYLHLARWNGSWRIVNVLWELKPQAR